MFRRLLVWTSVSYLAFWSVLFPDTAHAVVRKVKCEGVPNKYWTTHMVKNYARIIAKDKYGWEKSEYKALNKLWNSESHWRLNAFNPKPDMWTGLHAGGLPQILGMNPNTPAPLQIERGLEYIRHRYNKPSVAWSHHRAHGWY